MDYNSWVTRKKAVTQEIILSLVWQERVE
jgi:hypothetical protein